MKIKVSLERKPSKKREIREVKRLKKNVASTLDWMHIEGVSNHAIHLKHNKKEEIVMGFRIEPHAIHLDKKIEQEMRISRIRTFYNRTKVKLYDAFVFTPINLDDHITYLSNRMLLEDDVLIQEMLMDDIEKAIAFIENWNELSFYMMIKGKNDSQFKKNLTDLQYGLKDAGFSVKLMNSIDFDNYISSVFENRMINDFIFGHGKFECLEDTLKNQLKGVDINEVI